MSDERPLDEPQVDRVEPQNPDPSGPPEPVLAEDKFLTGLRALGIGAVALTGLVVICPATFGPTCGATRSARVQWDQRRQEMEQAAREDAATRARPPQQTPARDST